MRGLGVSLLMLIGSGCFQRSDCVRGDFRRLSGMGDDTRKRLGTEWLADAKACTLGDYVVYSPATGGSNVLWVMGRNSAPSVTLSGETLTVFQSKMKLLAQLGNRDAAGSFHSISYEAEDVAHNAQVSLFDRDFDGQPDSRVTYSRETRKVTTEHWIADHWATLVKQEGRYGYIVDGLFMPIPEGRQRLMQEHASLRDGLR